MRRRDTRTLRATLWLLPFGVTLVAMFSLQLSNLGFSPLLPSIQGDVGMSFTQLGFFTGIYGLLALLLSVPAGLTANVSARSACSRLGLVGVAIGSVLLGARVELRVGGRVPRLTIFGYRFAFVSVLIAVALTAPPALRGRTMGVLGATSAMASVVGAPLGGALVGEFGWRTAILGYASMALFGALVFWLFYRRQSAQPGPPPRPRPPRLTANRRAAPFARRSSGCSRSSWDSADSGSSRSRTSCRASRTPSMVSMPLRPASSSAPATSPRSC